MKILPTILELPNKTGRTTYKHRRTIKRTLPKNIPDLKEFIILDIMAGPYVLKDMPVYKRYRDYLNTPIQYHALDGVIERKNSNLEPEFHGADILVPLKQDLTKDTRLHFKDRTFDAIHLHKPYPSRADTLHIYSPNVPMNTQQIIKEVKRALKTGGTFSLSFDDEFLDIYHETSTQEQKLEEILEQIKGSFHIRHVNYTNFHEELIYNITNHISDSRITNNTFSAYKRVPLLIIAEKI